MASQAEYIYNKPSHIENVKKWYQPKYHATMGDWFPLHKDLKWRDDDVTISTYPRSGTHLMMNMAKMITSQDIQKTLEYPLENAGIGWFCFKDDQKGRRVYGTHSLPFDFGDDVIFNGNRKFIHVIRDPKSVCVSNYHMMRNIPTIIIDPGSFESFAMKVAKGAPMPVDRDWVTFTRAWEEYIDRYPTAPIMQIYFHDIIEDMEGTVRKVSDFLDVKLSEDKIKEIVEGCSLENMKKGVVSDELTNIGKDGNKPEFIRKGKRDDWKNLFTVALNEKFDSEISRRMQGSKIKIPNQKQRINNLIDRPISIYAPPTSGYTSSKTCVTHLW